MLRHPSLLPARTGAVAVVVALVVLTLAGLPRGLLAPARAAPAASPDTPLRVTLSTLTPSFIPRHGPIHVTGTVTNTDDEPWRGVNAYAFLGSTPMRTSAELAAAREVPETAVVGSRIATQGLFDELGTIEPGQTAMFSLDIPRRAIDVTEPGVYWFGVHALGAGPDGRVAGADGRARTFLPLTSGSAARTPLDTALVVPLRHGVSYAPDGSIADSRSWTRQLRTGGRLHSLLDFGAAAGSRPITWLVDPGLPDAVRALSLGNPPRTLLPATESSGSGSQSGSGSESGGGGSAGPVGGSSGSGDSSGSSGSSGTASPSAGSSAPADTDDTDDPDSTDSTDSTAPDRQTAALVEAAQGWLDRLTEVVGGSRVLALPYGDVDVAATAAHSPSLLQRARQRSRAGLGLAGSSTPAVAPPSGYLDPGSLADIPRRATVLVGDDAVAPALAEQEDATSGTGAPTVVRAHGHRLVVATGDVAAGGPGPDDPLGTLAVRQRILAEASVRLLSGDPQPLVVELPRRWSPESADQFFAGLDVSWLHLTDLADVARRRAVPVDAGELAYPDLQEKRELDPDNFSSAQSLIRAGGTLQRVLTGNDTVAAVVADQALHSLGYAHRLHPRVTRASTDRSRAWIEQQLGSIRIDAPAGVTLSSSSGRFAATLHNGLDEAVTVSIKAITDEPHAVTGPSQVDLGPGGTTTVLLKASADRPGVHNVTLVVTDSNGIPLGSSDRLPIRSAQVSNVIWLILGTGIALLFGAIGVRLVRRVRAARATPSTGPDDATTGTPDPEGTTDEMLEEQR